MFVPYGADSYTPFCCSSYDPPEPHDPVYLCKTCSQKDYEKCLAGFKGGRRGGDWQKSSGEIRAAKECGLVWVDSSGVGVIGTEVWEFAHQYISEKKYKQLSALPYYGWCKKCKAERKGGYCSDDNCTESFKQKTQLPNPTPQER